MGRYTPPLKDMRFVLEALGYEDKLGEFEAFEMYDLATTMAILETVASIGVDKLLPLNRKGDKEGLKFDPEQATVTLPEGFEEAYQTMVENGVVGLVGEPEYGGGGAPEALGILSAEESSPPATRASRWPRG